MRDCVFSASSEVLAVNANRYSLCLNIWRVTCVCVCALQPKDRAQQHPPEQCWKPDFSQFAQTVPCPKAIESKRDVSREPKNICEVLRLVLFVLISLHPRNNTSSESHLWLFSCLLKGEKGLVHSYIKAHPT